MSLTAFCSGEFHHSLNSDTNLKKNAFGKFKVVEKGFYDAMIFGSSRTYSSIHPFHLFNEMKLKSYKEARRGRYPKYFYYFYINFRDIFGKPKYLLYGIDYFMFKKRTSGVHLRTVLKKNRKLKKIRFEKFVNKSSKILSNFSLLFRIKDELDQTLSNLIFMLSLKMDDPHARAVNSTGIGTYTGARRKLKAKLKYVPDKWGKEPYVNSKHGEGKFLRKLFNELEKDGVTVVLVSIPDFIGTQRTNYQQDKFMNDMKNLIKGRENFYILNYNTPEKFDLNNLRNFKDGRYGSGNSHMSYWGGVDFNRALAKDLTELFRVK